MNGLNEFGGVDRCSVSVNFIVEMRSGAGAGISDSRNFLAFRHLVALVDEHFGIVPEQGADLPAMIDHDGQPVTTFSSRKNNHAFGGSDNRGADGRGDVDAFVHS